MKPEFQDRVKSIGALWVNLNGEKVNFLTEEEISNLNIPRGTLLPEEREIINRQLDPSPLDVREIITPETIANARKIINEIYIVETEIIKT